MRYRAGWLVQEQILALTHFEPIVTPEDFTNIAAITNDALPELTQEFHILIDNHIFTDVTVLSLEMILHAMPIFNHPQLRWIVLIVPEVIKDKAADMKIQQNGQIQLRYVDSLDSAYRHLHTVDKSIDWGSEDPTFFIQPDI